MFERKMTVNYVHCYSFPDTVDRQAIRLQDVLHSWEEGMQISYCDAEVPYHTSEHTVQTAVYGENNNIVGYRHVISFFPLIVDHPLYAALLVS